ncbi:MAG: cytochrome c oxidase assembly protein [Acidimicrobiia bacterium]|nr:cytochrome c oxidase assembly protein [bacterium]MXW57746.1 cytochrome c oxidase assembly protein [Acidimicrobiia bacterium]MXZ78579.1 cytochrome c oxidase assembly protein [Acidimicrobiia bacterium]MXZ84144.1 cytochrome c oxidase assembly protein [Acidimicrobiia bacterium]MYB73636.1 cytochrome c oxidase assembly protein [Acidimicrobiia bacterium]
MAFAADTDIWRYQPHAEVWIILLAAIAMAWYAARIIAPKAAPVGESPFARHHKLAFVGAMVLLWVASDWPMHDISEEYLYSVHMIQHLLITLVVPPLIWAAIPEWLARLALSGDGSVGVWVRRLARPVAAGLLFNFMVAVSHIPWVVNTSVESGALHYFVHLLLFASAMAMWLPVCGPIPELHMREPGKMVYLFLMSVVPTVPGGFLTFAQGAVYSAYDHDVRLWGIGLQADQQAAGLIMKLVGGMYLWTWIGVLFFRWAGAQQRVNTQMRVVTTVPSGPIAADTRVPATSGSNGSNSTNGSR